MSKLERIVMHWTAGTHRASDLDKRSYHYVIEGNGVVVPGVHPPEANIACKAGAYAPHVLNANTGSIGVSLCAMHAAVERPFKTGPYPITDVQVDALGRLVAHLCDRYGIDVTPRTVLTHAEVEGTLGIKQRNKWDIMWLPGMPGPRPAREVGDTLRERVLEHRKAPAAPTPPAKPLPVPQAALEARVAALEAWAKGIGYNAR